MASLAPSKRRQSKTQQSRTLTRDAVLQAAADLIRREGTETLTLRKLAADLSVTPMALYRHVDDKQDLLAAVLALILDGDDVCDHQEADWRDWLVETCLRMRRSLMRNPEIFSILGETQRMSVAELSIFEAVLAHLKKAGLTDAKTAKVFYVAVSFAFGTLAYEHFKQRKLTGAEEPASQSLAQTHPVVAKISRHLATPLSDKDFAASLSRILKGF